MHGTVKKQWRPSIAETERLMSLASGCCALSHGMIAASIHIPAEEFSAWLRRMTGAIVARPHALPCLKHLADLRAAGRAYPRVVPSDILRRADALSRAAALAKILPVCPHLPLPEPSGYERQVIPRGCGGARAAGLATPMARRCATRADSIKSRVPGRNMAMMT